jgi:hypothetical protein
VAKRKAATAAAVPVAQAAAAALVEATAAPQAAATAATPATAGPRASAKQAAAATPGQHRQQSCNSKSSLTRSSNSNIPNFLIPSPRILPSSRVIQHHLFTFTKHCIQIYNWPARIHLRFVCVFVEL